MKFDENGRISDFGVTQPLLKANINSGKPFLTSGCLGCNRPYYNEQPTGPIYNFPRSPTQEEIEEILQSLQQDE